MKGLRIIPVFLVLIFLAYLGLLFVEANRQEVVVKIGSFESPQTPLGFAILSSVFVGMVFASFFFLLEVGTLYLQIRKLKRKLDSMGRPSIPEREEITSTSSLP